MICPKCQRDWPKDCEQAIVVELRGECFACRPFEVDFAEVQSIQRERGYEPPADHLESLLRRPEAP